MLPSPPLTPPHITPTTNSSEALVPLPPLPPLFVNTHVRRDSREEVLPTTLVDIQRAYDAVSGESTDVMNKRRLEMVNDALDGEVYKGRQDALKRLRMRLRNRIAAQKSRSSFIVQKRDMQKELNELKTQNMKLRRRVALLSKRKGGVRR